MQGYEPFAAGSGNNYTAEDIQEIARIVAQSLEGMSQYTTGSDGRQEMDIWAMHMPTEINGQPISRDEALYLLGVFLEHGNGTRGNIVTDMVQQDGYWIIRLGEDTRNSVLSATDSFSNNDTLAQTIADGLNSPDPSGRALIAQRMQSTMDENRDSLQLIRRRNFTGDNSLDIGATDAMKDIHDKELRRETVDEANTRNISGGDFNRGENQIIRLHTGDYIGNAAIDAGEGRDTFIIASAGDIDSITITQMEGDNNSYNISLTTDDGGTVELANIENIKLGDENVNLNEIESGVPMNGSQLRGLTR